MYGWDVSPFSRRIRGITAQAEIFAACFRYGERLHVPVGHVVAHPRTLNVMSFRTVPIRVADFIGVITIRVMIVHDFEVK